MSTLSEIDAPATDECCSSEELSFKATAVLSRLRAAIGDVVHAAIAKGLHSSRDLQNVLGVDRNLSWQVFRMLGPIDTLSILPYVPVASSMKRLLSILKKRGVPLPRLAEADAAFAAFEDFARSSADDRERLETMLLSFSDSDERRQLDLQYRKAAFRSMSHFYGIEVETAVQAVIYYPGSTPATMNCVAMQQLSRMRRLRVDTEVVVTRMFLSDPSDKANILVSAALDKEASERYGAPVIPEFCSRPMPPLSTTTEPSGISRTVLASQRMGGAASAIDLAFGRAWTDLPVSADASGRNTLSSLIACLRPTQLLVGDLFIHRPTFRQPERECGIWSQVGGAMSADHVEQQGIRMPMREEFTFVGSGEDAARIRELPRYAELLRATCDRYRIPLDEMDLYRVRMDFPLVDSRLVLKIRYA